jgi:hypothetical protein
MLGQKESPLARRTGSDFREVRKICINLVKGVALRGEGDVAIGCRTNQIPCSA